MNLSFRILIMLGVLAISACTAPSPPESAMPANTPEDAAKPSAAPAPAESRPMPASSTEHTETSAASTGKTHASIVGAIRIGTRATPALRVCATALSGNGHYCTTTRAGATQYRIDDVPAGRYHLMGWARDGDIKLLAHADITRCVMPPCPPDELRVVDVAEGQSVTGIDLSAPYIDVPEGWPVAPAE